MDRGAGGAACQRSGAVGWDLVCICDHLAVWFASRTSGPLCLGNGRLQLLLPERLRGPSCCTQMGAAESPGACLQKRMLRAACTEATYSSTAALRAAWAVAGQAAADWA